MSRYDAILAKLDASSLKTQWSLSLLNFGQAAIFTTGLTAVMAMAASGVAAGTMTVGDLILDATAHRVTRRSQLISLGPTEFRLLKFFMEHPGRVFSRGQLLDAVWGTDSDIELRTVDVHIRRLRKAIEVEAAPDPVRTVRSAGYALEAV